ncbi:hemerythrin domain-containing protein [Comamonas flocculans]|uniref:Hemerythrin domain-containing protein n=1 Tax=Comamonas flocculans TaxID=2597701 RepID=A0A5B8RPN5_9BURK|nr:hemerythrin domain-containing protein [Comamonas flocculans]QEA11621.1 hemerythrin domain-containing protein [Comamonas flocculans]
MDTSRFVEQHTDILRAIKEMRDHSKAGVAENAQELSRAIMKLRSRVGLHLTTENKVLYPAIHALQDPDMTALAQRFQDEMQGLAQAFDDFCRRWRSAKALAADPEGFRSDANTVIKALHQRIQRENTLFYPRLTASR